MWRDSWMDHLRSRGVALLEAEARPELLGDGSPQETVMAPATVRFLNASKTNGALTPVFALRTGTLELTVDEFCTN